MIRVFNHYVHREALMRLLADSVLLLAVVLLTFALQRGDLAELAPIAGMQGLSLAAGLFVIGSASGIYRPQRGLDGIQVWARTAIVLAVALPLAWFALKLLPSDLPNRETLRLASVAGFAAVVIRRAWLTRVGARTGKSTRVLIFGAGPAAQTVAKTLEDSDPDVEVLGFVPGPNEREVTVPETRRIPCTGNLTKTAHELQVDEIVVALTERRAGSMPLRELLDCKLGGIKVYDLATHFEKRLGQLRIDFLNAGWMIFGDGFDQGAWRTGVKRVFDIVFSLLLIVVSAPVMLLTALLIKLDSPGPVFYRQDRVGRNGAEFKVAKFRSMRTDAEKDGRPQWATSNDSRVTRVGNVIRKLRIDELPQLFNVLKGEMSLVGPRPERAYFVEQLTQQIPYFAARHSVKPGVTGWAQVRYQYGATIEDAQEKLQYDLYYVKNHSLFLDLVVLFETVGVVLTGKGAR